MRSKICLDFAARSSAASVAALLGRASGQAQEFTLEKILNPMPDYDPVRSAPARRRQIFSRRGRQTARRELLIDALTNRNDALAEHVQFFKSEDARLTETARHQHRLEPSTPRISSTTRCKTARRYMAAQKEAIKQRLFAGAQEISRVDHQSRRLQSSRNALMRQSSTNFWGGMFNRMLGSVDLVGVASGNYIGAAAETTIAQLYALMDRDMAVEERRALARDLDHLKRFPTIRATPPIRKQVEVTGQEKKDGLDAQADRQSQRSARQGRRGKGAVSPRDGLVYRSPVARRREVAPASDEIACGELDEARNNSRSRRAGRQRRAPSSKPTSNDCSKP